MDVNEKRLAERILRYFCLGSQIVGVHWFQSSLFIEMEAVNPHHAEIERQEFVLTVEARWTVFPSQPDRLPEHMEELPDLSLEERVGVLVRLASQNIVEVMLGKEHPHLFLTFESGSVFFLWGYHEKYEPWNLSSFQAPEQFGWQIISLPGSHIALFAPQNENWLKKT